MEPLSQKNPALHHPVQFCRWNEKTHISISPSTSTSGCGSDAREWVYRVTHADQGTVADSDVMQPTVRPDVAENRPLGHAIFTPAVQYDLSSSASQ